jgi:hypothetical protein
MIFVIFLYLLGNFQNVKSVGCGRNMPYFIVWLYNCSSLTSSLSVYASNHVTFVIYGPGKGTFPFQSHQRDVFVQVLQQLDDCCKEHGYFQRA